MEHISFFNQTLQAISIGSLVFGAVLALASMVTFFATLDKDICYYRKRGLIATLMVLISSLSLVALGTLLAYFVK